MYKCPVCGTHINENEPHLFCNDIWDADGEDLVVFKPQLVFLKIITKENSPKK